MINISFAIDTSHYDVGTVQKLFSAIKAKYGTSALISCATSSKLPVNLVKRYALQFGFTYKEYNPANTNANTYSAMPRDYYGKNFHPSQNNHRYEMMLRNTQLLVVLYRKEVACSGVKHAMNVARRLNIPYKMLQ